MPKRKEVAWDPSQFPRYYEQRQVARAIPENLTAALMEAAPGMAPATASDELLQLREVMVAAIDTHLSERERYVFDAVFIERLSLRRLASILSLSKSQVARIRDAATKKLRAALEDHPLVREHLR